jgi:kynureninase
LAGKVEILTPENGGCQLSLKVVAREISGKSVKEQLDLSGIETDWREPNVIRAAPVPLYNQFQEIEFFVNRLVEILGSP